MTQCRPVFQFRKNPPNSISARRRLNNGVFRLPQRDRHASRRGCISAFSISTAASAAVLAASDLPSASCARALTLRPGRDTARRGSGSRTRAGAAVPADDASRRSALDGSHRRRRSTQAVPPHAGLGSGTQLALGGGGRRCARCTGLRSDMAGDAMRLGRGARARASASGCFATAASSSTAAAATRTAVPPIVSHLDVPGALARPASFSIPTRQGLHGADESDGLRGLAADFPTPTPRTSAGWF